MIENEAQKEILEDTYRQHREKADAARERDQPETAARLYRNCADTLEKIADLESSDTLAEKRRELAANLRTAAGRLESTGSLDGGDSPSGSSSLDDGVGHGESGDGSDGNGTGSGDGADTGGSSAGGGRRGGEGDDDGTADPSEFLEPPPEMGFDDVGGMSELKQTLRDAVIDPLERPELYEEYDLGVVNAVLLYGPPGTGKTYVTNALAGELGYNFVEVQATDITSSLVGEAADNVADLFAVARDNQPCLVFIDEIDALMPARTGGSQKTQSERQMVNQFLTELTETRGEDVVVVGATNLPEEVDDAAISRFEKEIEVPLPDATARAAILRVHLRSRPVLREEIDWERVKRLTEGYSARDLEIVATDAARAALEEARERDDLQPITQQHIETALEQTDPSLER